jgi:flagellar hook-associated protein 2
MAITANGIGSGLDINGMISQLMALEQRPLTSLARKEGSYQAKLSAFGQIKSVLSSLQTAANGLKEAAKFSATKATAGSEAGFTATSSSTAATGSYSVEVVQLAKVQRIATSATDQFAPDSGFTSGKLTITFGTLVPGTPATFEPDDDRVAELEFTGSTIEELRDAINADSTLGIKASVVDNGSAKQLVLTGTGTGANKAFSISGEDSLAALSYTPGGATTPSSPLYELQGAQDAIVDIDGIRVRRGSNTIGDAIAGVTLTLTKESNGASVLTVADDRSAARSAIEAFVKAYNDAAAALKNLTGYDAEKKAAAALTGDATARNIQGQLRSMIGGAFSGLGATSRLADIGITFQRDGRLAIDSGKLDAALADPNRDVASFFVGNGTVKGLGETISIKLDDFLGAGGLLNSRTDGINASIKALDRQRENLLSRLESVEKRYRAQFTALDSMIAGMTQTSNYLAQQLANLPKIRQ